MEAVKQKSAATVNRSAAQPQVQRAAAAASVRVTPPSVRAAAPHVQLSSLKVSTPSDPAEKEADSTARQVVRMSIPDRAVALVKTAAGGVFRQVTGALGIKGKEKEKDELELLKLGRPKGMPPQVARFAAPGVYRKPRVEEEREKLAKPRPPELRVQRKAEGMPNLGANVAAEIQASRAGGNPLPLSVRRFMEPRFKADFSKVRVHTGDRAAKLSRQLNAKAFAVGGDVFFGKGQFAPETERGKELIAHELTHTIQQGASHQQPPVRRSEDVSVSQHGGEQVQRLGISDALDYFADKANLIPGFRMLTIVIGVNPINMSRVERSAANIMRAIVEFIPGGGLITRALDAYGVFDKVGGWVEEQIQSLGMTGSLFRQAIDDFLDSLSWTDIFDLGGVWNRAKRIFTEPVDRLISFAKNLITGILGFIRDAILRPLAGLAEGTRGYDLLKAILGQDPITGDPVPRNAETLIGGFMKFIGQEEVWENIKKGNAIARAWAWFQGALAGLVAQVRAVPGRFMAAVKSLTLEDIVILPNAFRKVAGVFLDVIGGFFSWAGGQVMKLLEIVFDVVSPGAMGYVRRTGAALLSILKNPFPFVGNLVRAAKAGFMNFSRRFLTHLKAGLIDWLTGSLPGIYIPKAFTLGELVKFVFSALGLTWANVRAKLVKAVGETTVKAMETGFDIVVTLVKQGPAAAWDKIKEQLGNLQAMVIGGITDLVVDTVTKKAIPKLIAMFIPGAGFISAILSIYDTVMVFVQKISKIIQVVTGFINSITAIAAGNINAAATRVEGVLAGLLSLAINFLAGFAGLGRVSDKIMGVIARVRAPIDRALDALINWIVGMARRLGRYVAQAGVPSDPNTRLRLAAQASVAAARRLTGRVTAPLLNPILAGIKVRYGLTELRPVERGGSWWVIATINPVLQQNLGVMVNPADAAQTRGMLDLYRGIHYRDKTLDYDQLSTQQLQAQLVREEDFSEAVYSILGITRAQAPTTTPAQRAAAAATVIREVQDARNITGVRPWWRGAPRPNLFYTMLQRFVNRRTAFQQELQSRRVSQLAGFTFTDIPFISTTKQPARAAQFAKGVVVATSVPATALPSVTNRVVGKVFVYLFSGSDLSSLAAADIRYLASQGAIAPHARYSRADAEVTFTGAIPAANRVAEILVRERDSVGGVAGQARTIAQSRASGQGGLIQWS